MTIVHIGPATLILGDAYAIRPTLGWFDADVLDPPYLINASGGGHYRERRPNFDRMMMEDLHKGFDMAIVNPLLCGAAIVFSNNDQLVDLMLHLRGCFNRQALCIWQKVNPQPIANKHYRSDVEFYVHAWSKGHHPAGSVNELLRVRRIASPRGPARFDHPTTKPLDLMDSIMVNIAGDTVCDPFMGTGTTGVATIRAGKRFTGIEHNPAHFETACSRIRDAVERAPTITEHQEEIAA
jgi:site-specific DNA-methyltransferase (adenine-specific)